GRLVALGASDRIELRGVLDELVVGGLGGELGLGPGWVALRDGGGVLRIVLRREEDVADLDRLLAERLGLRDVELRDVPLRAALARIGDDLVLEGPPTRAGPDRVAVGRLADLRVGELLVPGRIDLGRRDLADAAD